MAIVKVTDFKVKNLRSLKNVGYVPIKKLTVLLGKNSVGKSSFLRTFPLLKQSLSANRRKPIIWYTKDLVDFGSFKDAVTNSNSDEKTNEEEIEFGFKLKVPISLSEINRSGIIRNSYLGIKRLDESSQMTELKFNIQFNDKGKMVASYTLVDWQIQLVFDFKENNDVKKSEVLVIINNEKFDDCYHCFTRYLPGELVPRISTDITAGETYLYTSKVFNLILDKLDELKPGQISKKTMYKIAEALSSNLVSKKEFERNLKKKISDKKLLLKNFDKVDGEQFTNQLYRLYGLYSAEKIVNYVNSALTEFFNRVQYIAPVRATAERYYRRQDLDVQDINPMGQNIPEMLASMSSRELKAWQNWTKSNFGIYFNIKTVGNNDSILLTDLNDNGNSEINNLSDVGFGYSQILPILLYIWRQTNSNRRIGVNAVTTILIEQPELHLHPAMQAAEMHALDETLSKSTYTSLMIETHSEYMVKQIGFDIANGILDPNDVSVLIFNDGSNGDGTQISSYKFTEDGYFDSWPFGFFQPNYL